MILVKTLIARKRSRRFADNNRLIGDYRIKHVDGEVRLSVEACSANSKDRAGQAGAA